MLPIHMETPLVMTLLLQTWCMERTEWEAAFCSDLGMHSQCLLPRAEEKPCQKVWRIALEVSQLGPITGTVPMDVTEQKTI